MPILAHRLAAGLAAFRGGLLDQRFAALCTFLIVLGWRLADWASTVTSPRATDLRNRIVGARAMALGLNPYDQASIGWGPNVPPALVEPFAFATHVSRSNAAPSILDVYRLFMSGDWTPIRIFWDCIDWAFLGIAVAALLLAARTAPERRLMLLVLALDVLCAKSWDILIKMDEYYIWLAALLMVDLALLWRGNVKYAGLCSGLALVLRPTLVIMVPVYVFIGRPGAALRAGAVGAGLLGASFLFQADLWAEFNHQVDRSAQVPLPIYWVVDMVRAYGIAARDGYAAPVDLILWDNYLVPPSRYLHHELPVILGGLHWRVVALAMTAIIAAGSGVLLVWRRRKHDFASMILVACWVPALIDLTAPIQNEYNQIFFLPAFGAICFVYAKRPWWFVELALILYAIAAGGFDYVFPFTVLPLRSCAHNIIFFHLIMVIVVWHSIRREDLSALALDRTALVSWGSGRRR